MPMRWVVLRFVFMVLFAAAVVVAVAGAAAAVEGACSVKWWPQARQNACNNGSAASPEAPSRATVARLHQVWAYSTGDTLPLPVVWKGPKMRTPLVYTVIGRQLHALEIATGRLRWTARAAGGWFEAARPVADGDLLLQHTGAVLRRYVPRSGHIVWQRTTVRGGGGGGMWAPVAADGNLYVEAGGISAYDQRTGRLRWQRGWGCFHCTLAASDGRVYAAGVADDEGDGKGAVYALDAATGKTIWTAKTADPVTTGGSPVLAGGRIFIRTMGGRYLARKFAIEAFRALDGKHLWWAPVGEAKAFWFTPPTASADLVVYSSEDGYLYALDAATGALRWRTPHTTNDVVPALVNGLAWASDARGRIVAYDTADGHELWASPSLWNPAEPNPSNSTPASVVVAAAYVLIGSRDGHLFAYHAAP